MKKNSVEMILCMILATTITAQPVKLPRSIMQSLKGRQLPFVELGVDPHPVGLDNQMLLVCFWDVQQGVSKRLVCELAQKENTLSSHGITVHYVETSGADQEIFSNWCMKHSIPSGMRMTAHDFERKRLLWGIQSLPWLIQTGKEHLVVAEGIGPHTSGFHGDVPVGLVAGAGEISGTVCDPNDRPVARAEISVDPDFKRLAPSTATDSQGRFRLNCRSRWLPDPFEKTITLVVKQKERQLAAVVELDGTDSQLGIRLAEAITLTGKVVDTKGQAVVHAQLDLGLRNDSLGCMWERNVEVDSNGRYEITPIPPTYPCLLSASAEGYGESVISFHMAEAIDSHLEVAPLVLLQADRSVSGKVVDVQNRPLAGVKLVCVGDGQPERRVWTDVDGSFIINKVCAEPLYIRTVGQRLDGYVNSKGGASNVIIVARELDSNGRIVSDYSTSLLGRSVPSLKGLGLDLPVEQCRGRRLLICFFDMNQRPSRNCLRYLQKTAQAQKGTGTHNLVIVTVQTVDTREGPLKAWVKQQTYSFPVGQIKGDTNEIRHNWGVQALPWLILTDTQHIVQAEGFRKDELETKLGN